MALVGCNAAEINPEDANAAKYLAVIRQRLPLRVVEAAPRDSPSVTPSPPPTHQTPRPVAAEGADDRPGSRPPEPPTRESPTHDCLGCSVCHGPRTQRPVQQSRGLRLQSVAGSVPVLLACEPHCCVACAIHKVVQDRILSRAQRSDCE
jgi:hypothetical protein